MSSRLREYLAGHFTRGQLVFTGTRRQTSLTVRGEQMAEELGGLCVKSKFLSGATIRSAPVLTWVLYSDPDQVRQSAKLTDRQVLDVINPAAIGTPEADAYPLFRHLLLNTESTLNYLGSKGEWVSQVIPHHHCNRDGYLLSEERLARPQVVGYVGEEGNLDDSEAIEAAVAKLGLRFIRAPSRNLDAYKEIDIGIAWCRRDERRDRTRSNIKLTNFVAHGIPAVACDFESYRDLDRNLGGGACLLQGGLAEWLESLAEVCQSESLRRRLADKGMLARENYSRASVAEQYRSTFAEWFEV